MEQPEEKKQIARSLVNSYEVTLLEETNVKNSQNGPTEERIAICFQTFDDIIPRLGTFQKVVKAVRDDMFDAIYSHQYTTNPQQNSLCRVPFFTLVNRIFDQRDEKADELRAEISALSALNNEQEKVTKEKDSEIMNLKEQIAEMNRNFKQLEGRLRTEKMSVASLQNYLTDLEDSKCELKKANERHINDLNIELQASFEESRTLRVFKNGYETLQEAFEDTSSLTESNRGVPDKTIHKKGGFGNPRLEQVKKDISIMDSLENQLYQLRNIVIQEHDDFMEKRRGKALELSPLVFKQIQYERDDSVIERESKELAARQNVFTKSIINIKEELSLLIQQRELLQIELKKLHEDEAKGKEIRKQKLEKSKGKTADSTNTLEEVDLVEIMAGKTDDPFVPHENLLSKYSAMIYTSCNEGKTFYEMPEISYCESCSVKTLLCPHAVTERERIFDLPKNCTHIKITRPAIKVKTKKTRKKTQANNDTEKENLLLPRMKLVWADYERRTTMKRKLERKLTEDFIISIINQFLALIIWQDDYQALEEETFSILDSFYNFLFDRYLLEDVMFLSAHDVLTAVETFASTNKQIHLFAACLDGSMDAATCRYVLLLSEFIESFKWTEMSDFSSFISIVYPFLQEEDLEQLRMGYTASSENKIAGHLVHDYLLYTILTEKEPRFQEKRNKKLHVHLDKPVSGFLTHKMEVKLLQCSVRNPGRFTDIEFVEAMDSLVPLAAERLMTRLYAQSVKHFPDADDTVNVRRISHISSYLSLIHNTPKINNDIKKWKSDKLRLLAGSQGVLSKQQKCKEYPTLITLSKIKSIGVEMARRAKSRRAQEEQEKLALGAYEL